jgi:hypothetical protein
MSEAKSDANQLKRVSFAKQTDSGAWADEFGFVGPIKPGVGPRSNPVGWFPTGPEIGEPLPKVVARSHTGELVDVEKARAGRPAVVVFHRSAVW